MNIQAHSCAHRNSSFHGLGWRSLQRRSPSGAKSQWRGVHGTILQVVEVGRRSSWGQSGFGSKSILPKGGAFLVQFSLYYIILFLPIFFGSPEGSLSCYPQGTATQQPFPAQEWLQQLISLRPKPLVPRPNNHSKVVHKKGTKSSLKAMCRTYSLEFICFCDVLNPFVQIDATFALAATCSSRSCVESSLTGISCRFCFGLHRSTHSIWSFFDESRGWQNRFRKDEARPSIAFYCAQASDERHLLLQGRFQMSSPEICH